MRPEGAQTFVMFLGAGNGDDLGAEDPCDLHTGGPHTAGGARDQHSLTGVEATLGDEGVVGGDEGLGEPTRLVEADVVGQEQEVFARQRTVRRLRATAHHPIAHGDDDAGELHARDVGGPSGGRGVEAPTLHQVGGVDAGRADFHQHVEGTRFGGGVIADLERTVDDGDGPHATSLRRAVRSRRR